MEQCGPHRKRGLPELIRPERLSGRTLTAGRWRAAGAGTQASALAQLTARVIRVRKGDPEAVADCGRFVMEESEAPLSHLPRTIEINSRASSLKGEHIPIGNIILPIPTRQYSDTDLTVTHTIPASRKAVVGGLARASGSVEVHWSQLRGRVTRYSRVLLDLGRRMAQQVCI